MNFLKKIFLPTILTISLLLLIYTFYKSEIVWSGTKRQNYFFYYFSFSFISIFIFFSIFLKNENFTKNFLLFLFSTCLSLYIIEGIFIFKKYKTLIRKEAILKKNNLIFDKRSRNQFFQILKEKDNSVTVSVSPINNLNKNLFPLSGISNSKTIYCNENGYFSIYQSDRYGFNNPDREWDNDIEYLLVGDSFAHGACVNRPNDIASVLRFLSKKSTLNLGYGGNGPLIEYATLREYLSPKVKKVIWLYYGANDFLDLVKNQNNKILSQYLLDLRFSQNLKFNQKKVDENAKSLINYEKYYSNKFIDFFKLSLTRSFVNNMLLYSSQKNELKNKNNYDDFSNLMKLSKKLISENNSKFYFVYLPSGKNEIDDYHYLEIKKIISDLDISFIDLQNEIFLKEKNISSLYPFGDITKHFNTEGYKKVAETIYKFTKD